MKYAERKEKQLAHKKLKFPEIPPELANLKVLEERLLAPRNGFIQIC